jgi:hypothetical protein
MLIFETKLKFTQYFLSILGTFHIIPTAIICFYGRDKDNWIFLFLLVSIFIGLVQFIYTLKSFHLYKDKLIMKRPFLFFEKQQIFEKNEIEKITFEKSSSNIGGGLYACVITKNTQKRFMLIYNRKVLNEFILKLKEVEIKVENQISI